MFKYIGPKKMGIVSPNPNHHCSDVAVRSKNISSISSMLKHLENLGTMFDSSRLILLGLVDGLFARSQVPGSKERGSEGTRSIFPWSKSLLKSEDAL